MTKKLIAIGCHEDKIHENYYGVDTTQFQQCSPEQNEPIFCSVGRFVEKKAPHLTLIAFKKTLEKYSEAKLNMIGDGPLLFPTKQLARSLHLQNSVTFMGAQSSNVVTDVMSKCRAFLQHSVRAENGDSEGTPVAVLEALASGLPVIATRHQGIAEVVKHNETGFLVDEYDIDEMSKFMSELIRTPQLASKIGEKAAYDARQHFSIESSISNLQSILEKCMGNCDQKSSNNSSG